MAHPDWALKFKEKHAELRLIRGKYYLYKVSSVWDKQKKRARKVSGEMVGRITEQEGLIPKGSKKTKPAIAANSINISTKEYGFFI